MAYCSSCKGVVHRTTKICPSCGGDFSSLFGPNALWGKPKAPQNLESARQKVHQEYLDRKVRGQTKKISQKPHEVQKSHDVVELTVFQWIMRISASIISWAVTIVVAAPIVWIFWKISNFIF